MRARVTSDELQNVLQRDHLRSSRRRQRRLRNSLAHGKMSSPAIEPPTLPRPSPARAQELSRKARSAHGGSQKLGAAIAVAKFEHKLLEGADAIALVSRVVRYAPVRELLEPAVWAMLLLLGPG